MKTIITKILLIIAGLLVISCTPITVFAAWALVGECRSLLTTPFTSILYAIPMFITILLAFFAGFGVLALGIGLIIYGIWGNK